ncbi:aminotransferase [Pontivivens insulae]|uniref:Beta-alanine--pyruvate aminotransferase n=1 Tax=Pontivivens insulae TaxID=1639689 RepID=A0A2R8AEV3_9RHOB|nr:aminotransferase [Pontivivens insulae]RED11838.1 4-aminobutyrate--pyruvate transaminase [Pontivivens insulae]SPF30595.1 Beta-alanine--pyruvate aminotransferase [Pontivivens insulae]
MTVQLTNMQTRDVEALLHPYTNAVTHRAQGAHVIERGEGVYIYDNTGKRFIEGMAGLWCCGLGFNNAELVEVAKAQLDKLPYYHLFAGRSFEPAIELAEKIKDLAPGMSRVFYQSSGSEANETQIKLAWYYNNALGRPDKKKIISRVKGYHGVSIVSASLTGLPYNHKSFDLPVDRIHHTATPHHFRGAHAGETELEFSKRLATELEQMIEAEGPDTIAAFIAEPVMGAGGVIVPPEGYFEAIMPVLNRYDILCIADEVICGFGRTGEWFGHQRLNMQPTSISMAKQLTSGYAPLSAVAINAEMADVIENHSGEIGIFGHGFTYGGHPMGCAVGSAALDIYMREDIPAKVRAIEPHFRNHLMTHKDHPLVGEARQIGLLGALELTPGGNAMFSQPGKVGAHLATRLVEHGVILRAAGDSLVFCPPMTITEGELDELFAPIGACLDATLHWARAEGHLG